MPQQDAVVKDTLTGLYCTSYNPVWTACDWGNLNNAIDFDTVPLAQAVAADMNGQCGSDRFIGQNPGPR